MAKRFDGKTVIITGAGGDIGADLAQRFSDEGANIVAVDQNADTVGRVTETLLGAGRAAVAVTADVTRSEDAARYVDMAVRTYGGVDFLINNAGIEGIVQPIESYPDEEFDKVIAVNVRGVFLGMKHAIPVIRRGGKGGAIVNLASVAGITGSAGVSAYNASKHAVIGLTRSAAAQLGPENIRVNAVCPSPVTGRMFASLEEGFAPDDTEAFRSMVQQQIPMQRYAESTEVAALIAFLCSPDASFVNGGVYTVDGGMTIG